jgi:hypothetical protein
VDWLSTISGSEMWGNLVIGETFKTGIMVFPVFETDFSIVIIKEPALIEVGSIDEVSVPKAKKNGLFS